MAEWLTGKLSLERNQTVTWVGCIVIPIMWRYGASIVEGEHYSTENLCMKVDVSWAEAGFFEVNYLYLRLHASQGFLERSWPPQPFLPSCLPRKTRKICADWLAGGYVWATPSFS